MSAIESASDDVLLPITAKIPRVMALTDLSRSRVYELIKDGTFATRKDGASTLVEMDSVRAYLKALPRSRRHAA